MSERGLGDDVFSYLPLKDANDTYHTIFPVMPRYTSQESNIGALYLDNGPWITQNMDISQPPPKDADSSSVAQSSNSEPVLTCYSRSSTVPTGRVKVPLPSIRQRTAQACDKCRERKTKCSGHRPVCHRCTNRSLACEYSARQTRLRLPTRSRFHPDYIRPITMQQYSESHVNFNSSYQPVATTHSHLGNEPPFTGICGPMGDRYLDWDEYRQQLGDPMVVTGLVDYMGLINK